MPSLRELVAVHAPLLVLDAASSRVQVGWVRGRRNLNAGTSPALDAIWAVSDEEAGVAIFTGVEKLGVNPDEAAALVFCDGPGSVLGVRTAAMALRTWHVLKPRPMFAYCSLALVAHALGQPDVDVIADARRDSWHAYRLGVGLRRVAAGELAAGRVMPEHFRHWTPLPSNAARFSYSVAELLPLAWDADLLLETKAPDAFLHEEPSYVKWTPQIHRAPGER